VHLAQENLTAGSLTFTGVLGIGERNLLHGGNRSAHVMGDISPDLKTFFRVSLAVYARFTDTFASSSQHTAHVINLSVIQSPYL
ncbi:hypothetical protein QN391_18095, partial [Pseudomonas sp. CCI1.2]|uniref:hypothetical protein n=1 Tax=Pseudomonas sp. CCI1.2 TaxID=3048614 RepID=UPI002B2358F4